MPYLNLIIQNLWQSCKGKLIQCQKYKDTRFICITGNSAEGGGPPPSLCYRWFLVYHVKTTTFAKGTLVGSLLVSEIFNKNPFSNQHFILAISPVIGIIESCGKDH